MRRGARWAGLLFICASMALAAEEGKEPEPEMMGWKWANFAILAAGLGYLCVKQVGPLYAARSAEIRKGIEEAQKLRAEAEARAAAMDSKLAALTEEVEKMRQAAKEEAAQEAGRITEETERELAKIAAHGEHDIASALKSAQIELKRYSAQLAIDLARQKVRERMTPADRDALVGNFVAELGREGLGSPPPQG